MNLKLCLASLATLAVISLPASGAIIAAWDITQHNTALETLPPAPWFQAANVTTSHIAYHGAVTASSTPSNTLTVGWGTTIDLNNYAGFTIAATTGKSLQLTSLESSPIKTTSSTNNPSTAQWGYRVDNGSGYGQWVMSDPFALTTASGLGGVLKVWDFEDFTTTGTVEFGLFAWGGAGTPSRLTVAADISGSPGYEMIVNGAVVPEPSAAVLGLLAGTFLLRRRR